MVVETSSKTKINDNSLIINPQQVYRKPYDEELFKHQVERLVESRLVPRKVLWETRAYLFRQGTESLAYDKYVRIINDTLLAFSKRINISLENT